ncbi:MAG: hypothetical protein AAF587_15630 [Bacteroidota bacterium]
MKTPHILSDYPSTSCSTPIFQNTPAGFMLIGIFLIMLMGIFHGALMLVEGIPLLEGFTYFGGGYISGMIFFGHGLVRNNSGVLLSPDPGMSDPSEYPPFT